MPSIPAPASRRNEASSLDDDDEGWQDMPVIRNDDLANGLDEEDQQKYHYVPPQKASQGNATGNLIDFDDLGNEWRSKLTVDENEYTRLRLDEEDEVEDVHLRTKYLFDEDKAMTPLSQMQTTKNLLTEAQRIAYVGLCALAIKEMIHKLKDTKSKELKGAVGNIELWGLKIMGRLYYHMELATPEQKMIESLANHGVQAMDLAPALITTHTVANPEYDPAEAKRREELLEREHHNEGIEDGGSHNASDAMDEPIAVQTLDIPPRYEPSSSADQATPVLVQQQLTTNVLQSTASTTLPGVSTTLSSADANVTLDIRWTVLCDLFLLLIADSVYDSRSRVLLENVASKLGLGWLDVVKFEKRVTDALEIQEDVESTEQKEIIEGRMKAAKKKRYAMMGLATIGGGLILGLSAGLLAPVIGAGLGAAFTTIGVTGTTGFFAGAGGAALITTSGAITGSGIAAKGMERRTRYVRTFELLPLHNNKRVNCIITVPGFMHGLRDDVRLPFSVLDPIVGDVFSVLWEPEMMEETGDAIKLLTGEILSQLSTTVLQATVMTGLMSALTWPIFLTKLGYLIDNPWSNALDRARAAGSVLAEVLLRRHLGVRPMMLIGFSLGARVIFYALLELAKAKAYGIVQDVIILGGTLTVPTRTWIEARSVVAGRFVNAYARNDWVLNYLFRATSGSLNPVAGLRPIQNVPGLENVDVTDKIAGHGSYRTFMPLILDQLGFPVSADYFDELEEPDMVGDREVIQPGEKEKKKRWWSFREKKTDQKTAYVQRPPSTVPGSSRLSKDKQPDHVENSTLPPTPEEKPTNDSMSSLPARAGFDFQAIHDLLKKEGAARDNEPRADAPSLETAQIVIPSTEEAPPVPEDPSLTPRSTTPIPPVSSVQTIQSSPMADSKGSLSQTSLEHTSEPMQPLSRMDSSPTFTTSRPPPAPTISFGAYDGTVWTAGSYTTTTPVIESHSNTFGGFAAKSPFSASAKASSSGSKSSSIFMSDDAASSTLSFGAVDGTISFTTATDGDPWRSLSPADGSKKSNANNANPWNIT